jgi:hypothetical protein
MSVGHTAVLVTLSPGCTALQYVSACKHNTVKCCTNTAESTLLRRIRHPQVLQNNMHFIQQVHILCRASWTPMHPTSASDTSDAALERSTCC